jgi:hypothetical protein
LTVNYSISKPTAGTSRATAPTETQIIADVSDTIADIDARLDPAEAKLAGIETGATADQTAAEVPITDAGGYYTATNVEGALQEAGAAAGAPVVATTSGVYYTAPPLNAATTPNSLSIDYMRAVPLWVAGPVTLSRIGCFVAEAGAAGAVVRLGIYSDSGSVPDSRVLDAGTVDAAGTTGVKEITISQALTGGAYWLVAATQVAASTLRGPSANVLRFRGTLTAANAVDPGQGIGVHTTTATTPGALPATFGPATEATWSTLPVLFVKIA